MERRSAGGYSSHKVISTSAADTVRLKIPRNSEDAAPTRHHPPQRHLQQSIRAAPPNPAWHGVASCPHVVPSEETPHLGGLRPCQKVSS